MTASNTTDSTAFDITDWLGEWESFEHYIDSDDAAIQQTWEAAEQAVLANPKMAPMAARGIRTFWSMACSTTSPENIIHIGYWRVNEPAAESGSTDDAALAIEWFAEDDTSLDTYEYTTDHVIEHGLRRLPHLRVPHHRSGRRRQPVRWLLATIRCLRARRSPRAGCSATCISSTPTICTRSSPRMRPPAPRPCAIRVGTPPCAPTREPSRTVAPSSVRCTTCSRPGNIRQYGGSPLVKLASLQ